MSEPKPKGFFVKVGKVALSVPVSTGRAIRAFWNRLTQPDAERDRIYAQANKTNAEAGKTDAEAGKTHAEADEIRATTSLKEAEGKVKVMTTLMTADKAFIKSQIELYKALGMTDEQIQKELVPLIKARRDPFSVLEGLSDQRAITKMEVIEAPGRRQLPDKRHPET